MRAAAVLVSTAVLGVAARADVYFMTDGDRITGKTVSREGGLFKVDTVYGRVSIPRGRIAKIVRDDGREEVLSAVAAPRGDTSALVNLIVVVTGQSFFQAWGEKEAGADSSLRFEMSVDEEPIASYTDSTVDPEIEGAVTNAFSFETVAVSSGVGAVVQPPETRPGRITLRIDLPTGWAGERRLRFVYQGNEGSAGSPAWRDLIDTLIHVTLDADKTNIIEIEQDQGKMDYGGFGKKHMRNVETFRIAARPM